MRPGQSLLWPGCFVTAIRSTAGRLGGTRRAREPLGSNLPSDAARVVSAVLFLATVGGGPPEDIRARAERVLLGAPADDDANGRRARGNGSAAELTYEHE